MERCEGTMCLSEPLMELENWQLRAAGGTIFYLFRFYKLMCVISPNFHFYESLGKEMTVKHTRKIKVIIDNQNLVEKVKKQQLCFQVGCLL